MSNSPPPDLIPGLEDFWAPSESAEAIEQEVNRLPPKFAAGRKARYVYGVVYRGPFETMADGVCTAVRHNACALRRAKVPVFLQSPTHTHFNSGFVEPVYYGELPQSVRDEVDHLVEPQHEKTAAWIEHFVPTFDRLVALTSPGRLQIDPLLKAHMLKSTAAYIALEHDVLPEPWVAMLGKFGRIAVPCSMNKQWLKQAGIEIPIDVVPHALGLKDPMRSRTAKYESGTYKLLTVGKWEPRKNQHALIGAFLEAFSPDNDVTLTIKSSAFWNRPDYPKTPDDSISYWIERQHTAGDKRWTMETAHQRIIAIWNRTFSREEMADLYASHHGYVQSGRSEGFDLPCLDAKVVGLRVAGVGYGGPIDFMSDSDMPVCWDVKTPVPAGYLVPEGTTWPAPGVQDYVKALRLMNGYRDAPIEPFDVRPYLLDSVGAQLRQIACELAQNIGVDLAAHEAT